jgi:hypothetical protein
VFQELKDMTPPGLRVFNVLDRVDPMSLKMLKDSILRSEPDVLRERQQNLPNQARGDGNSLSTEIAFLK